MITCLNCGAAVGIVVGLPVAVSFNDEFNVATVNTDVADIADHITDENIACRCGEGKVSDADHDRLVKLLEEIAHRAAPSLDIEVA